MRYLMTIAYDGSDFCGFQRQNNVDTIQGEIEKNLSKILQENVQIVASGRTDAKVHAIKQKAHFDSSKKLDTNKVQFSLNSMINKSISIINIEEVDENFHARYNTKRKTYVYKIYLSKINEPLKRKYFHICSYNLNVEKMKEACNYLIGEHDFKAFSVYNPQIKSTIREIFDIHIDVKDDGKEINIFVEGNGFLHNMVRSIAGTLVDIGRGRFEPEYIKTILDSCDHQKAGKTLDGCGLYLLDVQYD